MEDSNRAWSRQTFGEVDLGHRTRTARLVTLAASAAALPGGTVTSVVRGSAAREGAYRLLESERVPSAKVAEAVFSTTTRSCLARPWVFVPVDGSSLSFTDRKRKREVGGVGTWKAGGRGLQVMSALVCSPRGTPVGLCAQQWWAREGRSQYGKRGKTPAQWKKSETRHGVETMDAVQRRFRAEAPGCTPWLQLDRGFDSWPVLEKMVRGEIAATVRAQYNRCCRENRKAKPEYLLDLARKARVLGSYAVEVPASDSQAARTAVLQVRARRVTIELHVGGRRCEHVTLTVVHVKERGKAKTPLQWTLLTTFTVTTLEQAQTVVRGYATRWRIEELHRTWKRGGCHVEDTQLRSREAILKWATILAAVAARTVRLAYLAREKPDTPALEELSPSEIDAAILLAKPKGVKRGATPTLGVAVGWIATAGGYTGKSSGGPPGPTVLGRGLMRVEIAAQVLRDLSTS